MKTYAGIDLHSSNNYIGIIDAKDKRLYSKRPNSPDRQTPGYQSRLILSPHPNPLPGGREFVVTLYRTKGDSRV
jgi:hypothetical protein